MFNPLKKLMNFSYDAVNHTGKRKSVSGRIKPEHEVLKTRDRYKAIESARDMRRNFSIVQWAINKHLDYVSSFDIRFKMEDQALNHELKMLMNEWCGTGSDISNRHTLKKAIRILEGHRVVDGNAFIRLDRIGKLQYFEDDRIANATDGLPKNMKELGDEWVGGIRIDPRTKAATKYMITDRDRRSDNSRIYRDQIDAKHMIHVFYSNRFEQYRGLSPMLSALNSFRDTYEGLDAALMKLKIAQMFGIVFYRDAEEAMGDLEGGGTDEEEDKSGYQVDMGKGPVKLDLEPGDKAEFLESATPPQETQAYLKMMIQVALKSLDIPYSFFDESFTNFYGSRGGMIQYQKSCKDKQQDLIEVLNRITRWRLFLFMDDKQLKLPLGMRLRDIKWQWVPSGTPWFDPKKEVEGHKSGIKAGFTTPQKVCQEIGEDFYENVEQIKKAKDYAAEHGVELDFEHHFDHDDSDVVDEQQKQEAPNGD